MVEIVKTVQHFFDQFDNASPRVLVAVSGGADSVALFRLLVSRLPGSVVVAHVNHRLRGAESDEDEEFVRELAGRFDAEFRCRRVEIGSLPGNLEANGRSERYRFFEQIADETGADWIATAHTLDDQAETVLHRMIRGSGIQGLRGIARVSGRCCRPLLEVRRAQILAYLQEIGQDYRTDSSNQSPEFTRNRIRHELLPLLASFNPAVSESLARLAEQASEAQDTLDAIAADLLTQAERPRAGSLVILETKRLLQATLFIRSELFRQIWRREGWPENPMTHRHWNRLALLTVGDYPGGISLHRTEFVVQLGRKL